MTGDVNFSSKMAKSIDISKIKDDEEIKKLSVDKQQKLSAIFNTNTKKNDQAITIDELSKSMQEIDTNHDGKLTDAEMSAAWESLPDAKKQGIQKTEYISYLKAMAKANAAEVQDDSKAGNSYVIQLGEDFNDLIIRIMKSNGEKAEDCTAGTDKFNEYVNRFKADNAHAFKANADGSVKWLIAGQKIFINTDTTSDEAKKNVKDLNNADKVEEKYKKWADGKGELKSFKYKIDDNGNTYEVRGSEETQFNAAAAYADAYKDLDKTFTAPEINEGKLPSDNKDVIKERLTNGLNVLTDFANAKDKEYSTETGKITWNKVEYNTKEFTYDNKKIKVLYDKSSGEPKEVWIDADGSGNYEVSIKADGSGAVYTDPSDSKTKASFSENAVDFSKVMDLVKTFAGEKFDDSVSTDAVSNQSETAVLDDKKKYKSVKEWKDEDGNTITIYSKENETMASILEKKSPQGKILVRAKIATAEITSGMAAYYKLHSEKANSNMKLFEGTSDIPSDKIYRTSSGDIAFTSYTEYDESGKVIYDETAQRLKKNWQNQKVKDALFENVTNENAKDFIEGFKIAETDNKKQIEVTLRILTKLYPDMSNDRDYQICSNDNFNLSNKNVRAAYDRLCKKYEIK